MTLKKYLFFTLISALFLLFGPEASAQTSRLYFAGYLGLSTYNDLDYTDNVSSTEGSVEFNNGLSFAGAMGLRLSRNLRIEGEVSYTKSDLDRIEIANQGDFAVGGEFTNLMGMINVYYDFDVDWPLQPFVGAGVGVNWYEGEVIDSSGFASNASDDNYGIAWQVGGGAKYRVRPDLAFTGGYRYLDSTDLEFNGYELDYSSHEFRIGLEYDIPVH